MDIVERLREASSRDGKPSGAHMIDGQRMLARHFAAQTDSEEARCIAEVADCMAHCIENEALLFECLKTEALHAANVIEGLWGVLRLIADGHNDPRSLAATAIASGEYRKGEG